MVRAALGTFDGKPASVLSEKRFSWKVVPIQKVSKVIDETIILRAQRGDARAFQRIVEEYHGVTWRTARILLGDPALAEDVLQEACTYYGSGENYTSIWSGNVPGFWHPGSNGPLQHGTWTVTATNTASPHMKGTWRFTFNVK